MGKWLKGAAKVRAAMDAAGGMLDDAAASKAVEIYPMMRYDGAFIAAGTRIRWGEGLKRAAAGLWDAEENSPDNAPALWEDVLYRDGVRIIPETVTAGLAFAKDELGWWGGTLYRSLIDTNVYTPEQYPAGWEAAD